VIIGSRRLQMTFIPSIDYKCVHRRRMQLRQRTLAMLAVLSFAAAKMPTKITMAQKPR
jgi:hypothetical protein